MPLAYENGRGVEKNTDKAIEHYRLGAELGSVECKQNLGCCYLEGDSVPEDKEKGFALCMEAAELGFGPAMRTVGRCYQFGNGVKESMKQAVFWYEKALEVIDDPELAQKVAIFKTLPGVDDELDMKSDNSKVGNASATDDSEKMHTGVFIDVEPVDRIPGKMIRRLLFYYDCFRYELYSREYIPGGTVAMRFACKIMLLLTNHAGRMRKIKTLKQRITSYKEPDMQRVIIANFVTMGRPLPSDIMDTYSTMTFEGEEYMVIDGWEILLKTWYGDFMKLPPVESRKPGHLPISLLLE